MLTFKGTLGARIGRSKTSVVGPVGIKMGNQFDNRIGGSGEWDPPRALGLSKWITVLLLSIATGYVVLVARNQFLTGDPTFYLGLARSLAEGRGYTFMNQLHTTYPPGLSAILLPFVALGGSDPVVAQTVIAVFAPLSLGAVLFFTWVWDRRLAVVVGVMALFSYTTFSLATIGIRTELPFLAVSAATLALLHAVWRNKLSGRNGIMLVPVLVVSAVALRTIGIALPTALVATWLHRRIRMGNRREPLDHVLLAGGGAGLAFCIMWLSWSAMHGSGNYFDLLFLADPHKPDLGLVSPLGLVERIPHALLIQLTHYGELAFNVPWLKPLWTSPLTILLGMSLAAGVWEELKEPSPVLAWYVLGYGSILLLWPFDEGIRFLVPVFPMILVLSWKGMSWLWRVVMPSYDKTNVGGAIVLIGFLLFLLAIAEASGDAGFSKQNWAVLAMWLPVVGAGALVALKLAPVTITKGQMHWALCAFLVFYCAFGLMRIGVTAYGNVLGHIQNPNPGVKAGVDWLARHADEEDVVMMEFASAAHFYTGLVAFSLPKTSDHDVLVSSLDDTGTTYLMVNYPPKFPYYFPTEMQRLAILLEEMGDRLRLVHRFGSGEIYRVE